MKKYQIDTSYKNFSIDIGPLFSQVAFILEEDIKTGEFKNSKFLPSERRLCESLKVSRIILRRALAELEEKGLILKVPKKRTLVTRNRKKTAQKTLNIGILFGWEQNTLMHSPYFSAIFRAAADEAERLGYKVIFIPVDSDKRTLMIDRIKRTVDGLLISEIYGSDLTAILEHKHIPFVLVNWPCKSTSTNCSVVIDNYRAAYETTRFLVDSGHKRIGFLSINIDGFKNPVFIERCQGYLQAMRDYSLKPHKKFIVWYNLQKKDILTTIAGYEASKTIFEGTEVAPTALFCCNDMIAIGAMQYLKEKGIKVPSGVSITGFDDIEPARDTNPPLTTVKVDRQGLGALSVRKLVSVIENGESDYCGQQIVPAELIIRGSVSKKYEALPVETS